MISFRFHVVSITAVFLAIAIGVLVGTTYVDRAVVDSLESRVNRVSNNLDTLREANSALEGQVGDLRSYTGASADFAVTGRLTDVPVLLLAARGTDEEVAAQLLALARRSGARIPGVAWLEGRWTLGSDDDRAALAEVVGVDPDGSATTVRNAALTAVVAALGPPPEGLDAEPGRALLQELVDRGFVSVDAQGDGAPPLGDLSGASPRVLLVTSADAEAGLERVVASLVGRTSGAGLPTVVAEEYVARDDGPDRGTDLRSAFDEEVRDRLGLVDDVELSEGRVAAVLALGEVAAGRPGHFGYGSDADGVLPVWSDP